jgi:BlaI family transcriptional regulator, penicillinase repressor
MKIAAAESQILEALWRKSPLSFDEIVAAVGPANGWAAGTVRTLVTRLLRKKAIEGSKAGDAYVYRPLIARSSYVRSESQGLLDRLFDGEVTPLVAALAEHRALTPADLAKLEALILEMKAADDA